MPYNPIQGQDHGDLIVAKMANFKVYLIWPMNFASCEESMSIPAQGQFFTCEFVCCSGSGDSG